MSKASTTEHPEFPPGAGPLPTVPGVEVDHEFYDLPAGRFHVARIGDRSLPPLMLVHGFPQHWWCWRGVIQQLAGEAHLIVPDLRGAGWSSLPTGPGAAKKDELGRDLLGLLDAMELPQVAVASHDWGGMAAQLLALRAPDRVSRLLVFSMAPAIPTRGQRLGLKSLARLYYQVAFSAPGSNLVLARFPSIIARGIRQDVQQRENFTRADAEYFAAAYADPGRAKFAQQTYRSFILGDARAIFKSMRGRRFAMPVRFVLSAFDAYVPREFAASAPRTGPEVEALLQDRTGHFVMDEDPTYAAEQIREWLLAPSAPA